jgi:hypothetical protein
MTEATEKRRGRPPGTGKHQIAAREAAAADVAADDQPPGGTGESLSPAVLEVMGAGQAAAAALPEALAKPEIAKLLDHFGFLTAAKAVGDAINDPDQKSRDEVRELCRGGMPVIFHYESEKDAAHREEIAKAMDPDRPGLKYAVVRRGKDVEIALRQR